MDWNTAIELIFLEYRKAIENHIPFQSQHEGYAIIKEELDELWDEIKKIHDHKERSPAIRKEALQVCAMAIRFLIDFYEE